MRSVRSVPTSSADRHRVERGDAAADGVERELADGDGEAAVALVADAEDGAGVGGDDHAHVVPRVVLDGAVRAVDVERRQREPARGLVEEVELLHRLADRRRVDDGQHLGQVPLEQRVEEDLVALLQRAQVLVLRDRRRLALEAGVDALELLLHRVDLRRQQAVEPERDALLGRERGALVGEDQAQERDAVEVDLEVLAAMLVVLDVEVVADLHGRGAYNTSRQTPTRAVQRRASSRRREPRDIVAPCQSASW